MTDPEKDSGTALRIPTAQMERYKRTARARWQAEKARENVRCKQAWTLARQAVSLLKEAHGVQRVVGFGSLTHAGRFTLWSDVDIAARD